MEVWPRLVAATTSLARHPDVRSWEVVQEDRDLRRTTWELLLRGSVLHLTVDETFDHGERRVSLSLVDGDVAMLAGAWLVREAEGGAVVDLNLTATFGLPLAGDVIDGHLHQVFERMIGDASVMVLEAASSSR